MFPRIKIYLIHRRFYNRRTWQLNIFFTHLYLLEGNFEGEWFVVVRIKGALLDRRLLLFQSLAILHQGDLDVRVREATDVHLLQVLSFQNDHRKLAGCWHVSQREAYVSQFVVLQSTWIFCLRCILKYAMKRVSIYWSYSNCIILYKLDCLLTKSTHLSTLAFNALQFPPLFDRLRQIDLTERHFDLADLVVFRKSIEIEDSEDESLIHGIGIRDALHLLMTIRI